MDADVLIAGAGPVGAVLAALLAQQGVSAILADRETGIYRQPRAAHFDAEIMRIFQQIGIADAVAAEARTISAYEFVNGGGDVLMRFDVPPMTAQGWPASFMFHQPAMETALRAKLAGAPQVDLALGWALASFRQDDGGVTAMLRRGDEERRVRVRYLVGCDGGNSLVRKAIDAPLFDYGFDEPWLVIDTVMPDESRLKPCGVQVCDPRRPTTIMPMSPGRRRWEFMLLPGETAEDMLDDTRIAELLAPYAAPGEAELVRKAVYRFHGLVATRWREGRVLLAGDAAHQMPPFAGQGMCSGLRDAANLAWKLAFVLRGDAGDGLLDTYQSEREPHVRTIIEGAIAMGKIVCTLDAGQAAARDAHMIAARAMQRGAPAQVPGGGALPQGCLFESPRAGEIAPQPRIGTQRLDDVVGHGFTLATATAVTGLRAYVTTIDPGTFADAPAWAKWLGAAPAALIQPDRYVFGTGPAADLLAALSSALAG
ncbi:MAG: bifunctional 3-(3-hydroxy-phenyl)propionate/3-hydroxycinnamic acid hydroxylase [Alphaproteobacteria bacterium]|nr:bifunctional 3-(3-hydroxy-phenyl)propionate/3-hydroxycinnamic acid hydroxylase [Alphaproteobacteria bacterium]